MIIKLTTFRGYLTLITLLLLSASSVTRATADVAQPSMSIRIDGNLDDAAWKNGRQIEAFKTLDGKKPLAATTGIMLTDANYLHLAFRCEEPEMSKLQTTPVVTTTFTSGGSIWHNDCIEIYVAPFGNSNDYYHLAVDASGQIYDAFIHHDGIENVQYGLDIRTGAQKQQNSWTLEVAMPLCEVGLNDVRDPLMNFARERKPQIENTSWHGGFGQPETWQHMPLSLGNRYPLEVRDWNFGSPAPLYGSNDWVVNFISNETMPVKVRVSALENQQWKLLEEQSIQSTRGKVTHVSLPYSLWPEGNPQSVRYELESNGQTAFRLTYRLNLPPNGIAAALPVFYYYAEEKNAFLQLDSFITNTSLKSSNILFTVQSPDGKVVSTQKIHPLRKSMRVGFDISKWNVGIGHATVEVITNGKIMSRQKLNLIKRPGPFSESTF